MPSRRVMGGMRGLAASAGSLFRRARGAAASERSRALPADADGGPRARPAEPDLSRPPDPTAANAAERVEPPPVEPDPEEFRAARARRFRRAAEAGIGIAAVAGGLAIVAALVVAFGLQTASDDGPELEVGGPQVGSSGPVVSNLGITRTVGNLEITLLRVERLSRGGRVYLRADNKAESDVAIPDTEITVRQRQSTPARPAPNRGNRLPRFGASIRPGEREFSVLYVPRLRRGGAVVTVPWFTRSTDILPEPAEFSFQVQ